MGNSAYGKIIEAVERQTNVAYTKDEKVVDKVLRSAFFEDFDEIRKTYEPKGTAVYQLAKLRMLEFHYDFLDKFVDRADLQLI